MAETKNHRRRSIRLKGYNYSDAGAYFVTLCVQNRACLFGDIKDDIMRLNDAGQMIEKWYCQIECKFPDIQCSDFVCMPNHVHFIIINVGADLCVCPDGKRVEGYKGTPLSKVVQWFKTMSTNRYIRGVKHHQWQRFPQRLWQRNYYEHIIRDEDDLNFIQQYIQNNPAQWPYDTLNPQQEEQND